MIPIETLIDTSLLYHKEEFAGRSALDFLGDSLKNWIANLMKSIGVQDKPVIHGTVMDGAIVVGPVYIAEGAVVEPTAYVQGPCYIGPDAQVRHGAYIRGQVYVGKGAVVGHTTEVKGSVLADGAKAAHFAYVGDSLLGRNVNLGAGTKIANLKLANNEVKISLPGSGKRVSSGMRKFGALMGDEAQTGCNSVLSPGSILMPGTIVYPAQNFVGTLNEGTFKG